jgi:hypothetical protein
LFHHVVGIIELYDDWGFHSVRSIDCAAVTLNVLWSFSDQTMVYFA